MGGRRPLYLEKQQCVPMISPKNSGDWGLELIMRRLASTPWSWSQNRSDIMRMSCAVRARFHIAKGVVYAKFRCGMKPNIIVRNVSHRLVRVEHKRLRIVAIGEKIIETHIWCFSLSKIKRLQNCIIGEFGSGRVSAEWVQVQVGPHGFLVSAAVLGYFGAKNRRIKRNGSILFILKQELGENISGGIEQPGHINIVVGNRKIFPVFHENRLVRMREVDIGVQRVRHTRICRYL